MANGLGHSLSEQTRTTKPILLQLGGCIVDRHKSDKQLAEERFNLLCKLAVAQEESPQEGHFVDDSYFLTLLAEGRLTKQERQEMIAHLAACGYCRRKLGALAQAGLFDEDNHLTTWWSNARLFIRPVFACLVAASLLVGIVWWYQGIHPGSPSRLLADARQALSSARYDEAIQILESWKRSSQREVPGEVCQLLEEASYLWAKDGLIRGDYRRVFIAQEKVHDCPGESPRMRNLVLQAQLGIPAEFALDRHGTLLDFGYEPDGRALVKTGPNPSQGSEANYRRLFEEFKSSLSDFPNEPILLLNFGYFCMRAGDYAQAESCFNQVVAADPRNARALVGMGLIKFEFGQKQEAAEQFEAALVADPDYLPAKVNLAICYEALGRRDEALAIWTAIQDKVDDHLHEQIKLHLERRRNE